MELYQLACSLFEELWDGRPIRLLGVRTSKLVSEDGPVQLSLFDLPSFQPESPRDALGPSSEKLKQLDAAMDRIRRKYGKDAVKRGRFL